MREELGSCTYVHCIRAQMQKHSLVFFSSSEHKEWQTQLSFTLQYQSFSFNVLFSAGRESGRPAREDGGGLEGDHLSPEHQRQVPGQQRPRLSNWQGD